MPRAISITTAGQGPIAGHVWVVGRHAALQAPLAGDGAPVVPDAVWRTLIGKEAPAAAGRTAGTWVDTKPPRRVVAAVLPEACSRHNSPSRAWAIPKLLAGVPSSGDATIVLRPDDPSMVAAQVAACARAFPTHHNTPRSSKGTLRIVVPHGQPTGDLLALFEGVRLAAHLVDMPPNQLDVPAFVDRAEVVAGRHDAISLKTITGDAVRQEGLGGLWGVGKAAAEGPALVVLDYLPPNPTGHDAWVGKGIVYDTGGLSIKSKTGMPGMKMDMGGAAAVLAALDAAATQGVSRRITAVLCLAENAIGRHATRPDDVLHMYSGRTVEVNNTDAEGRLVLADGVAWVHAHIHPDTIIQLATLTGAQAVATGQRHAAVVCDNDALEAAAIASGRRSGDLVHPLPFAPEFYVPEFRSQIADLKNSVKNRANAQSSCAGEFIRQHVLDHSSGWLHIDLAAPASHGGRGTGFGVALLLDLARREA